MSVSDGSLMISLGRRLRPMGGEMKSALCLAALVEMPTGARKRGLREEKRRGGGRDGFKVVGEWWCSQGKAGWLVHNNVRWENG